MKKNEILKLIDINKKITDNIPIMRILYKKNIHTMIPENIWFPRIDELQEQFDILKQEVKYAIKETRECQEILKKCNCPHEIRLNYSGLFTSTSVCILCGQSIVSDNCVNWELSINRNKYCVNLTAKYQNDDIGEIEDGYTDEDVREIISKILIDKEDNEEIDLVQEFKKLNLKRCQINEEKRVTENYILIIGGSNKQYIDTDSYLYKTSLKTSVDVLEYFSGLLNTKVELIDNSELLESEEFKKKISAKNYNLKFTNYKTIEELEKILNNQKEIPFKIILDLSELYTYRVEENVISKESYNIKLNEIFPSSYIIRINNLASKSLEQLSNFLKRNQTQTYEQLYAYKNDNNYYYLENNKEKKENLENMCSKIKRLLRQ